MLKVIIADDEERICKLIRALIDWESLDMQIEAVAHNGLEALDMVREVKPDILITDIRMPGLSGLELIEQVKKDVPDSEIIIISGYAHFEYAKSAIKFGVGDYLLKPVNQSELYVTLQKLRNRIMKKQESESDIQQLLQKNEKDIHRLQMNLMEQLIEQRQEELSLSVLQKEYYLNVCPGEFQAFWIKVDGKIEEISESGMTIIMDKVQSLLRGTIAPRCYELVMYKDTCSCIGFMNFQRQKADEIRRILRDCINQLEAQKSMYGAITFSCAVGCIVDTPEQLGISVKEASTIIKERLVKGTGRILDKMPQESNLHEKNLLDYYLRFITPAIEVLSLEDAKQTVLQMKEECDTVKNGSGEELLELIAECGRLFLNRLELKRREQAKKEFEERCMNCGTVDELFNVLIDLQDEYLGEVVKQHENDAVRPIRQAKQYVQNHFSEQITMEEVSSEVGLSAAYFSTLFKKVEGEGFAKYLIHIRMEEAKRQLRESNASVADICRNVGYNDLKHFTHTFEKHTGVKPATYRKLYG